VAAIIVAYLKVGI